MRLLSPVIASALVAAALLPGCGTAKKQAEKRAEPCTTQNYSPAEIFQQTSPSIVVIRSGDSLGSGFVVKQDKRYTYILTNSHVVNRADEVQVKWFDDREEKGKVISDHGGEPLQKDLALVRVDAIRGEPLLLKEQPPAVGEDVVVIGAPQGLEFSLSRGVMSQLRNKGDFLQVDAAVNPGNSGGPLFDKTGCVVGVVTFKSQESEGLNFAIGHAPTQHFLENPAIERPKKQQQPPVAAAPPPPPRGWVTYHRGSIGSTKYLYQLLLESKNRSGALVSFRGREIVDSAEELSERDRKFQNQFGGHSEGDRYLVNCGDFSISKQSMGGAARGLSTTWSRSAGQWRHESWAWNYEPDPNDWTEAYLLKQQKAQFDDLFRAICNL